MRTQQKPNDNEWMCLAGNSKSDKPGPSLRNSCTDETHRDIPEYKTVYTSRPRPNVYVILVIDLVMFAQLTMIIQGATVHGGMVHTYHGKHLLSTVSAHYGWV